MIAFKNNGSSSTAILLTIFCSLGFKQLLDHNFVRLRNELRPKCVLYLHSFIHPFTHSFINRLICSFILDFIAPAGRWHPQKLPFDHKLCKSTSSLLSPQCPFLIFFKIYLFLLYVSIMLLLLAQFSAIHSFWQKMAILGRYLS